MSHTIRRRLLSKARLTAAPTSWQALTRPPCDDPTLTGVTQVTGVVCQMVAMIVFVIVGIHFYWRASRADAFPHEGRVRIFAAGLAHASF